jgi:hypothetical protein
MFQICQNESGGVRLIGVRILEAAVRAGFSHGVAERNGAGKASGFHAAVQTRAPAVPARSDARLPTHVAPECLVFMRSPAHGARLSAHGTAHGQRLARAKLHTYSSSKRRREQSRRARVVE